MREETLQSKKTNRSFQQKKDDRLISLSKEVFKIESQIAGWQRRVASGANDKELTTVNIIIDNLRKDQILKKTMISRN